MLPRLVDLLDTRPAEEAIASPVRDSVNIPLDELAGRLHELPRSTVPLRVFGPLPESDRNFESVAEAPSGEAGRCRLWYCHPLLWTGGGRALDLGCGAGRDAVALSCLGWNVTAVDNLESSIRLGTDLERRYSDGPKIDWQVRDLRKARVEGDFDLIMAAFFWYPQEIADASRQLRSGGRLLIEMFTPTDQEKHGKPKRVTDAHELRSLFAHLNEEAIDEEWRHGRHTVRALFTCP